MTFIDQIGDPRGHHSGLSAAGTGDDAHMMINAGGSLPLSLI